MALADMRTFSSFTLNPQAFQLFQPKAGVKPILSPMLMVNFWFWPTKAIAYRKSYRVIALFATEPLITPVAASSFKPSGRPGLIQQRPFAGCRYQVQERVARPGAKHIGTVNFYLSRWIRR
jgi:hypothetical protein